MGTPFPQLRDVMENWKNTFSEMGNYDLEVSPVRADFDEISEVKIVSVTRQECRGVERELLKVMSPIWRIFPRVSN